MRNARLKRHRSRSASPLLEAGAIDGARGILINITGSSSLKLAEVQQACSIIQSAAHDEANIIFGAVLDEKMKDAVKITVIATGFRDIPTMRSRHHETRMSFAAQHEDAMEYADDFGQRDPMPEPISPKIMADSTSESHAYVEESSSMASTQTVERDPEVVALETMRNALVSNFEQSDLDVPAFLRKRNEVM